MTKLRLVESTWYRPERRERISAVRTHERDEGDSWVPILIMAMALLVMGICGGIEQGTIPLPWEM